MASFNIGSVFGRLLCALESPDEAAAAGRQTVTMKFWGKKTAVKIPKMLKENTVKKKPARRTIKTRTIKR